MRMHRTRSLAAVAGLLLLGLGGTAAAQGTIRCESSDNQYRACPANTSGGVTLSRQLSSQGCWQGDTWGYDRNRIWVTRGCRAEFRIGTSAGSGDNTGKVVGALVLGAIAAAAIANHNGGNDDRYHDNGYDSGYYGNGYGNGYRQGRTIRCESQDSRYRSCGTVDRRDRVEIQRQLSDARCIYGRSWGVDGRRLWVDDGCRADFVVY